MSDQVNYFSNPAPMPARPVKHIYELWLKPNIPIVNGMYDVPWGLRAGFRYERVGELIGKLFSSVTPCQILIPNDWVDITTFNERISLPSNSTGENFLLRDIFNDFSSIISHGKMFNSGGIIDVWDSKEWSQQKTPASRNGRLYPPAVIHFCVLTDSTEQANWWYINASMAVGDFLGFNSGDDKKQTVAQTLKQGVFPVWFLEELNQTFEVSYEPKMRLSR